MSQGELAQLRWIGDIGHDMSLLDWLRMWAVSLANAARWRQHAGLQAWLMQCRLNVFAVYLRGVKPDDFSAALIAYVESHVTDPAEKNALCTVDAHQQPVGFEPHEQVGYRCGLGDRVQLAAPRAPALRSLNWGVSFPAVRSLTLLSLANPLLSFRRAHSGGRDAA